MSTTNEPESSEDSGHDAQEAPDEEPEADDALTELEARVADTARRIPRRVSGDIRRVMRASSFSGPLPPPAILRGYNDIVTNGAERIFRQFELESDHRRSLERAKSRRLTTGLILAGVFALGGVAAATWLMAHNQATTGVITLIGILATVTGTFIYGPQGRSVASALGDRLSRRSSQSADPTDGEADS